MMKTVTNCLHIVLFLMIVATTTGCHPFLKKEAQQPKEALSVVSLSSPPLPLTLRQLGVRIAMDDLGNRLFIAGIFAQVPVRQAQAGQILRPRSWTGRRRRRDCPDRSSGSCAYLEDHRQCRRRRIPKAARLVGPRRVRRSARLLVRQTDAPFRSRSVPCRIQPAATKTNDGGPSAEGSLRRVPGVRAA